MIEFEREIKSDAQEKAFLAAERTIEVAEAAAEIDAADPDLALEVEPVKPHPIRQTDETVWTYQNRTILKRTNEPLLEERPYEWGIGMFTKVGRKELAAIAAIIIQEELDRADFQEGVDNVHALVYARDWFSKVCE